MPDRKQVIWDIERCICHVPDACRDCSKYKIDGTNCMETLMADALTLLREQEPKKPKISELRRKYCGACGWELVSEADRYCRHCGREVKWE